jgi:tRNA A-37 threonylcarbamoyl transferase component Bud32
VDNSGGEPCGVGTLVDMGGPRVPRYDIVERQGGGGDVERWVARERGSGVLVTLEVLPELTDIETRDRLRRQVAVLAGLDHPHLLCPRAVAAVGDGLALVREHVSGRCLSELLAARGKLTAGEAVTLAVPLADALAALHRRGLVHGRVDAQSVHVAAGGRPQLVVGAGSLDPAATAAGDVAGLAATCLSALASEPSQPLRRALEAAVSGRLAAAELVRALFAAAPALPLRCTAEVPATALRPAQRVDVRPPVGRHRSTRPRRRRRPGVTAVLVAAVGVGVAAVAGIGWAAVDSGHRPTRAWADRTGPAAGDRVASWYAVLADLDAARARAFASADPAALDAVYSPGSPALARDRAALARLAAAGLRADGLRIDALDVAETARGERRVRLRVADVLRAYALVDAAGAVVETRPGRGRASWTVTLLRGDEGWQVYDVARS